MRAKVLCVVVILCGCSDKASQPISEGPHYEAHCKEPLPVFSLGEHSNPTKAQEEKLCSCIWNNLSGWERDVSEKLAQGKGSEVSALHMQAFPPRFGAAVKKCGGMDL